MLCNATDALEVVKSSIPVLSKTQFKKDGVLIMLKLYAKRSKNFLNMFNDMAYVTPVVAPGMAVKMYSEQQQDSSNNETLRIVRNTLDLDITVYVKELTNINMLNGVVKTVFYRFDMACNHFVDLLNQQYDDLNIRLVSRCRQNQLSGECSVNTERKQGYPFINRNVFSVKQYFILFPDQTEIELMDVVVVYQAGREPMLHHALSNATGFPLPTRGYLADELWSMIQIDTLGESNLNKKRHPITGREKQKGVKDLYRLKYVAYSNNDSNKRVYNKYHGVIVHLINILKKPDYTNAKKVERIRNVVLRH